MSLLPKSHSEFSTEEYWQSFFKKRGTKAFEWYGEYAELCGILHKYIKAADKTLVIGCGNSRLSADLYDVGYHNITNIDISDVAIKQMKDLHTKTRPKMQFLKMDMLNMEFEDGQYSVVLDKGTLDALMTDESDATVAKVDQMFSEIARVLRIGGRYVCISLSQDHILRKMLQYFPQEGWMLRVCRVMDLQDEYEEKEFQMPVFVFVCTKFKKIPNMKSVLEVSYFDDKVERLSEVQQVADAVRAMQQYGVVRQQLNKRSQIDEPISLDLFSADSTNARYTLHVVNKTVRTKRKFAIFIVPEGREVEWLFSTGEGRLQLADTAGFERLVVVTLHRGQVYESLDSVKAELSSKVMELAPPGLPERQQVPFLSIGDEITKRTILYKGNSELSGEFVVEDVTVDPDIFRRLIYMSNKNAIQSEARLFIEKAKGYGEPIARIDQGYLSCTYQQIMVAGLALLDDFHDIMESTVELLLVGLGGGSLATFWHRFYKRMKIEAVELDPMIVEVAQKFFGLRESPRLKIVISDGLSYTKALAQNGIRKHVIVFDINSSDLASGLNGPPQAFLTPGFLQCVHDMLYPSGLLMINFTCRNQELREDIFNTLKSVFSSVYASSIPEELNEIVYALPKGRINPLDIKPESSHLPRIITGNLRVLHDVLQLEGKADDVPRLLRKLDSLKLI